MSLRHMRTTSLVALAGLAALTSSCSTAGVAPSGAGETTPPVVVPAEVTVEGAEAAEQPAESAPGIQAEDPVAALQAALEAKDYAALEALMTPSFGFGLIASEGVTYTPAEFAEQLELTYLGPGDVRVDLARDIRSEVGSDYRSLLDSYARTLYSTGWGEAQSDTALLFLDEEGRWAGMLYMFEGLEALLLAEGEVAKSGEVAESGEGQGATTPPPPGVDNKALGPFQDALLEGITTKRNYALLQSLMGDPFVIGYWRSQGVELTPAAATEQLQTDLLPPEAYVSYTLTGNLSALLDGQDPLTLWGPDVKAVRAIRSTGWGPDGKAEAILIIARREDGSYYWHGILYAPSGF